MSIHTIQLQPFSLAGAGTSIGATSIILTSFTKIDGTTVTMTDFGTIGYGTLEPSTAVQEEQISFSGVTQNINGTATLTGVKTVLMYSPYTETSGLTKSHAGGTVFIVSDNPGLWNTFTNKQNNETITGTWIMSGGISSIGGGATTFASFPISPSSAPTTNYQLANKKYVDDTVVYGAPNASTTTKGIAKLSYAPASPTEPIAFGSNDPAVVVITGTQSIGGVKTFTDSPVISKTTHSYLTINPTGASQEAGVILQKNGTAVWTIKKTTTDTLSVYNTTGPIDALNFANTTGVATFGAIPILPATNPTTDDQATRKAYVDGQEVVAALTDIQMIASDNLRLSADTEQSFGDVGLVLRKSIRFIFHGILRVKFDMKIDPKGSSNYGEGRIYCNGVAIGTLQSTVSNVYATFSEDIDFTGAGMDYLIQLYSGRDSGNGTVWIKNFRVYGDKSANTTLYGAVILN